MCVHNVIPFIRANRKCWIQPAALTSFAASTVCKFFPALSNSRYKGAPHGRFFVCASQLILLSLLPLLANSKPLCPLLNDPVKVRLAHIIDGDTVVLESGEHLRLIGIDTPETGYKERPAEPGAIAARNKLNTLLKPGQQYLLDRGIERRDRHGRSLGHLFLGNGENIQALLLAGGLATVLNIPPNIRYSKCYTHQADRAITAGRGLWRLEQYQARAANELTGKERDYRRIVGKVTNVRRNSSDTWITLDERLTIRIIERELKYFSEINLSALVDSEVQVQGLIYSRKKRLLMRLRHAVDLKILKSPEK